MPANRLIGLVPVLSKQVGGYLPRYLDYELDELFGASGSVVPTAVMPESVQTAMQFSPGDHVSELVCASWTGESWSWVSVAVLVGVAIVFGGVGMRFFRWKG